MKTIKARGPHGEATGKKINGPERYAPVRVRAGLMIWRHGASRQARVRRNLPERETPVERTRHASRGGCAKKPQRRGFDALSCCAISGAVLLSVHGVQSDVLQSLFQKDLKAQMVDERHRCYPLTTHNHSDGKSCMPS